MQHTHLLFDGEEVVLGVDPGVRAEIPQVRLYLRLDLANQNTSCRE